MLRYNIERMILMRGHTNPKSYLKRMGYTRYVISHLLSNPRHLDIAYIERFCHELRCTPNDLMEWEPSKSEPTEKDHPLTKLRRNDLSAPVQSALLSVPAEKLDEAVAYLQQLGKPE
ncbi:helix-turn-helix transcriptional regulator [uncultured Acetobacteroides sp.]|uniref:helix-turn-helix domain-containing protein n=1 Tax=uncultured Acetobacteroides sp. TaxID=1760811 RepID=UPI0029F572B9|nr:helix-turn-helix transcriptional regulator [uncultured Acetobacteroides sp.]